MAASMLALIPFVVASAAAAAAVAPVTIDGTVYVDENRNGVLDSGEPAVPGAQIWVGTAQVATSDGNGHYSYSLSAPGIQWARVVDGFEPTPVWAAVDPSKGARSVDLGFKRQAASGNVTFVHASDSHINNGIPMPDVRRAFDLAVAVEPKPHFLVVTGDITNDSGEASFQTVLDVMEGTDVPFVPVVGNHDNYDGEVAYQKYLGPSEYCFDQGGAVFVILDFSLLYVDLDGMLGFVDRCLAGRDGMPAVAFIHAPMPDDMSLEFANRGIDYLFTGHWHSNRLIEHGSMEEVNTQTFVNGGIDATPAGYRIVRYDGERMRYEHRTVVEETVLALMAPPANGCVAPGDVDVIVAAESGTSFGAVTVSLDGGPAVATVDNGGWDRIGKLSGVAAGQHTLIATGPDGGTASRTFCASATPIIAPTLADWTQLQGSAEHQGATDHRVSPPLEELWLRSVGGYLRGGSVVVSGGRVFVPVVDLGDGTRGGVVALDALTGSILWEKRVGYAVHNAPAVVGNLVVFGASNGVVHGVDSTTGTEVWSTDLGAGWSQNYSWLYAAPSVADGVIYIGVERHFAAIDAATGRELWSMDPSPASFWLGSFSAAGVGGGVVVVAVARGADGIVGLDAIDGHTLWRSHNGLASAVNAGIIVDSGRAYLGDTYAYEFALDLVAPVGDDVLWQNSLEGLNDSFGYGTFGTAALAQNHLIVPTSRGGVVALEPTSGTELWRAEGDPPVIRTVHGIGSGQAAFMGSPVVTGDLVWIGGADGKLRALSLDSGEQTFMLDLGAPILGGVVPAGDLLYVGTFDGTVHALRQATGLTCPEAPGCVSIPPVMDDGGCSTTGAQGGWTALALVAAAVALVRRRRA